MRTVTLWTDAGKTITTRHPENAGDFLRSASDKPIRQAHQDNFEEILREGSYVTAAEFAALFGIHLAVASPEPLFYDGGER